MRSPLLLSVVLLTSQGAHAQAYSQEKKTSRRTVFGVKAGLNRSDLQSSRDPLFYSSFDYLRTFAGGGYWQQHFNQFAFFQAEVLYSGKGFRHSRGNINGEPLVNNRLDYLELPLLFVAKLTNIFSLQVGPQAAVLVAARTEGQALDLARSGYQRFDLGAVVGVEARVGPGRLGIRYDYSLPVLNRTGTGSTTTGQPLQLLATDNTYHNLVLQAYVGVDLVQ